MNITGQDLILACSAIGAGLAVWGVINLLEGYGNDNPGAKSQGIKQLMAGGGTDRNTVGTTVIRIVRLSAKREEITHGSYI